MIGRDSILRILGKRGIIDADETGAKCDPASLDMDLFYAHAWIVSNICCRFIDQFVYRDKEAKVDTVISAGANEAVISHLVARHFTTRYESIGNYDQKVFSVCAEENIRAARRMEAGEEIAAEDKYSYIYIRDDFKKFIAGKNVFVVRDIIRDGDSTEKLIKNVRKIGGNIVGLGAIFSTRKITPEEFPSIPEIVVLANLAE